MLRAIFEQATEGDRDITDRNEGTAFLKATASLYRLLTLDYLCLDLPVAYNGDTLLRHSLHGIGDIKQKVSLKPAGATSLARLGLMEDDVVDWRHDSELRQTLHNSAAGLDQRGGEINALTVRISTSRGESALFGLVSESSGEAWAELKSFAARDLRILMTYYHGHMLRLSGASAESDMIVSARELDYLKWTAAGKTAWEASRILGISERTVRFHLNSAREKLNCANTTQAVAKAISENWISV